LLYHKVGQSSRAGFWRRAGFCLRFLAMLSKITAASGMALLSVCFLYGPLTVKLLLVLLTLVLLRQTKRPSGMPPGPWGLPFLGYLPFIGANPHETYHSLSKKYGPIFSVPLGQEHVVILDDFKLSKDSMQKDEFSGRPVEMGSMAQLEETKKSILATDGVFWKEHRRFALSTFRDFGMGKSTMEPAILNEIQMFLKEIDKKGGDAMDIHKLLGLSVCNIVCILEVGHRFEYEDPIVLQLKKHLDDFGSNISFDSLAAVFGSWIMKVPFASWLDDAQDKVRIATEGMLVLMRKIVDERKKTYVPGSRADYIDAYFAERIEREKSNTYPEYFDDKALLGSLIVLLAGGTDATISTVKNMLLYLMMHPDVQRKVQQEIDDVIGKERLPSMEDRSRMPYTEATILEVNRVGTVVPMNAPHTTMEDVTFGGYKLAKDTKVFVNIWAVHHDEAIFPDPFSFRPERFINADGKFVKSEAVIPFAIGKRFCLGEPLARMELFLYFTSILQKFNLVNPEGQVLTTRTHGMVIADPLPYLIRFVRRD